LARLRPEHHVPRAWDRPPPGVPGPGPAAPADPERGRANFGVGRVEWRLVKRADHAVAVPGDGPVPGRPGVVGRRPPRADQPDPGRIDPEVATQTSGTSCTSVLAR